MPKFIYKAKKGPKDVVEGVVEAQSCEDAVEKLTQMDLFPIKVSPQASGKEPLQKDKASSKGEPGGQKQPSLFKKVSAKELTVFLEQLSSLIRSKVPLLEAVSILYEQTDNLYLKEISSYIQNEIKEGATLSQSLRKYPKVFPVLYVNMIDSGEVGGVLEQALMRVVELRNKEEEVRSKVVAALAYPIFIIIVGIITVFVLLAFVIPRITVMFSEMGQTLPFITRVLITVSTAIKKYWFWAAAAAGALIFTFKRRGVTRKEKIVIDKIKLGLPVFGDFLKKAIIARFARTLSTLLANGIPLFQAIDITVPVMNNEIFRMELEKVRQDIVEGGSLANSLKRSEWFPRFVSNIIAVGEKGGRLKEALAEVSGFYERDIDATTKTMASLIEPAIILVMGLLVGFIVMAMILPIFQMNVG